MRTRLIFSLLSICLAAIGLSSCANSAVLAIETTPTLTRSTPIISVTKYATSIPQPAGTSTPTPTPTPEILPPDPQPVTFQASDGTLLHGYYYPAAVNPAPLVVMMHWAGDDMSSWYEVAVWLQNRGQKNPFPITGDMPWFDPSWFPEVPAGKSYAVLLFTFRGCSPYKTGCVSFNSKGWLDDAQSAMLAATKLEGVDPNRIVAIGSSIGGDGAADGCLYLNSQYPETCKGAFSLSPDNYLTLQYDEVIAKLGQADPPIPVWCVAAPFQYTPCRKAQEKGNSAYEALEIPNGQHGMGLIRPGLKPLPMQLMLDFLDKTIK